MPKITITGQSGDTITLDAEAGHSLMEVIRDNGFDEMLAMCGGSCSCATCHVYIDSQFADKIPPMTNEENDLLDVSDHRTEQSRLSCQITVDEALEGLIVMIAPED